MSRRILILLKTIVWLACLAPIAWLVWGAVTSNLGPDPTGEIAFDTGATTLWLLIFTLAISPVRRILPGLNWLIKFRRLIGLFAFFYGTIHLLAYVGLYAGFNVGLMLSDIAKRRYITAGVAAYLLLIPLAATSTTRAIRKLGGKKWNLLHMLIYPAAALGVIHFWWQQKPGVLKPLPATVVLVTLLAVRPVLAWRQRRRAARAVAA
ncbi:MAG TPA: protein-methionine-sulfoxide reductase heme-binding subunit MsrQ [Terracidiphilus sp.]|nr:protein-methionine-sulfoxide reductase heme-binding subunit MsrQ [Terracidiphilus sp.]